MQANTQNQPAQRSMTYCFSWYRASQIVVITGVIAFTIWAAMVADGFIPLRNTWFANLVVSEPSHLIHRPTSHSFPFISPSTLPIPSTSPAPLGPTITTDNASTSDHDLACGTGREHGCDPVRRMEFALVTVKELPRLPSFTFCVPPEVPKGIVCRSSQHVEKPLQFEPNERTEKYHYCIDFYGALQPPDQPEPGAVTVVEDSIFMAPLLLNNTLYLHQDSYQVLSINKRPWYRSWAEEWNPATRRATFYEANELPFVLGIRNGGARMRADVSNCAAVFTLEGAKYTRPCGWGSGAIQSQNTGRHFSEPVFFMDQPWSGSSFGWHGIVENFLRAAPFVEQLKASNMTIITPAIGPIYNVLWNMLGISPKKVLQQQIGAFSADIVYLPNYSGCGINTLVALRAAQRHCLAWIETQLDHPEVKPFLHTNRTIVVLKRTHKRFITNHDDLVKALNTNFGPLGYAVQVHEGNEGLIAHAYMFAQAKFIIGPHGAGMSLLFCARPDAVVIEVTPPDPNLCYAQMSLKLGLEHHFMTPPPVGKPNAMVADVATIISILRARLGRE